MFRTSFSEDSVSSSASLDSALDGVSRRSEHSPSPGAISAALDEYVSASKDGRAAFASGDIPSAVSQFDQALDIELQTEMKCLYDTSIGMVSGLVRKEVDSRLHTKDTPATHCDKILDELTTVYKQACTHVAVNPQDPNYYITMGAALCIVNQWEKAKLVYKEGINMCKDKVALKAALKQLVKMELMLGTSDLPREEWKPVLSANRQRAKTVSVTGQPRPRSDSRSSPVHLSGDNRYRSDSLPPSPQFSKLGFGSPSSPRKKKFSLNSIKLLNNDPVPTLTLDETTSWTQSFSPTSTVAGSNNELRPSAIAHMRKLSVEETAITSALVSTEEDSDSNRTVAFKAAKFTSLKIDSDDSELEDN